eukprot:scaffold22121_cov33-Phaeocystis_antarctica.AAC.1
MALSSEATMPGYLLLTTYQVMLLHLAESKFAWIHSGVQLPAWAPARGASTAAAAAAGAAGAAAALVTVAGATVVGGA